MSQRRAWDKCQKRTPSCRACRASLPCPEGLARFIHLNTVWTEFPTHPPLVRAAVYLHPTKFVKAPRLAIRDLMIFCIDSVSQFKQTAPPPAIRDAALPLIIFFTAPRGIGWYFTMTSIKIQINSPSTGHKGWSLMSGGGAPYERWLLVQGGGVQIPCRY